MVQGNYFIEFPHYDVTLKNQERLKYLLKRYRDDSDDLKELKADKIKELDNFLTILEQLRVDFEKFKKLIPKKESPKAKLKEAKKTVKEEKKIKKKSRKRKKSEKKSESIKSLRLGLSQIRDELAQM